MKNRKKLEIIADILDATLGGAKKTHIMYGGNLSFSLLKHYLDLLTECNFLIYRKEESQYFVSDRGKAFLDEFRKLHKRLTKLRTRLDHLEREKEAMEHRYFQAVLSV